MSSLALPTSPHPTLPHRPAAELQSYACVPATALQAAYSLISTWLHQRSLSGQEEAAVQGAASMLQGRLRQLLPQGAVGTAGAVSCSHDQVHQLALLVPAVTQHLIR